MSTETGSNLFHISEVSPSKIEDSTLLLKEALHRALGVIEPFSHCALLDHPNHTNVGDSMIWLGEIFYLSQTLKATISYAASIKDFSDEQLTKQDNNVPILLHGGGNFGDLWKGSQDFRNYIISKYKKRSIVILPQTIYFADPNQLIETAKVLNSHSNLTLFVRDDYSYEIACQNFQNCQVFKSPDMALEMIGMDVFSVKKQKNKGASSILYHCREDQEINSNSSPQDLHLPNLVVEDWGSQKYQSNYYKSLPQNWLVQRPARMLQGLQAGDLLPIEWLSRQRWKHFYPNADVFNTMYNPSMHRDSWSNMHQGIYQFRKYHLVITNRLHEHILCILMSIPHLFLSNSYYKNEQFYKTWTHRIPFCRFVNNPSEIEAAAQDLLELYSVPIE